MKALNTQGSVKGSQLEEGKYYAIIPRGTIHHARRFLAFSDVMDIKQVRNKYFETHVVLKDYKNYIGTYNIDTGARDTIQKTSLITGELRIKTLGKLHEGCEILELLKEIDEKGMVDQEGKTLLDVLFEDIGKDKYFVLLQYTSKNTGQLIIPNMEVTPRDVQRVCGIISKNELLHYKERYPEIVRARIESN